MTLTQEADLSGLEQTLFEVEPETLSQPAAREVATGQPLEAGSLLGHYRLRSVLGKGAQGVVWRAKDQLLERPVALKFLPAALAANSAAMARMKDEAKVLLELSHENIVRLHTLEATEHGAFLVMEHLGGPTLSDVLQQRRSEGKVGLSVDDGLWLLDQLAPPLDYANGKGITHRDIKPANLMLTTPVAGPLGEGEERAKLCDFGVAFVTSTAMNKLTGYVPMGTMAFIPPEVLLREKPTPAADIYSLGATLYCLVAGHPIFLTGDLVERIKSEPPPSLASGDSAFDAALARALAKDPEERFASADEMLYAASGGRLGGRARGLRGWSPARSIVATVVAVALIVAGWRLFRGATLKGTLLDEVGERIEEQLTNAERYLVRGTVNSMDISGVELAFECHEGEEHLRQPSSVSEGSFECDMPLPEDSDLHVLKLFAEGNLIASCRFQVDREPPELQDELQIPGYRLDEGVLDVTAGQRVHFSFDEQVVDFRLAGGLENLLADAQGTRVGTVSFDAPAEGVTHKPRRSKLRFLALDRAGNEGAFAVPVDLYSRALLIEELETVRPTYSGSGRWAVNASYRRFSAWRGRVEESSALVGNAAAGLVTGSLRQLEEDYRSLDPVRVALAARQRPVRIAPEDDPLAEVDTLFTSERTFTVALVVEGSRAAEVHVLVDGAAERETLTLSGEQERELEHRLLPAANAVLHVTVDTEGLEPPFRFDLVHDDLPPRIPDGGLLETRSRQLDVEVRVEDSSPLESVVLQVEPAGPLRLEHVSGDLWLAAGVQVPEGPSELSVVATDLAGNASTRTLKVLCDSLTPQLKQVLPPLDDPIRGESADPTSFTLEFDEPLASGELTFGWRGPDGALGDLEASGVETRDRGVSASVRLPTERGEVVAVYSVADAMGNTARPAQELSWKVLDRWGELGEEFRSAAEVDPQWWGLVEDARHHYPGRIRHVKSGLELVYVPGGEFEFGARDPLPDQLQLPGGRVSMSGFYIGRTEVSWRMLGEGGGDVPEHVSRSEKKWDEPAAVRWEVARSWCEQNGLELPTEARWEFAASGVQDLPYPWGRLWVAERANIRQLLDSGPKWEPVESREEGASWCGALHMVGNAREWCLDIWPKLEEPAYGARDPQSDYSGEQRGTRSRVVRGGSKNSSSKEDCHSASRSLIEVSVQGSSSFGFRPVWIISGS